MSDLALSDSPSPGSPLSKKRKRGLSNAAAASAYPTALDANGKLKPRRIDPDRLATRLGSDLTADLDKFLVPGAKMPSFAVRQELVKRYNVDRRHIYDYLHSRGLRVAKEDKHLNLSRKAAAAAAKKYRVGKENIPPPDTIDDALPLPPKPAKRRKVAPPKPKITIPALPPSSPEPPYIHSPETQPMEYAFSEDPEFAPDIPMADTEDDCQQTPIETPPTEFEHFVEPAAYDFLAEDSFALDGLFDAPAPDVFSPHDSFVSVNDLCSFSQQERASFYETVNATLSVEDLVRIKARTDALLQPGFHYDYDQGPPPTPVYPTRAPVPVALPAAFPVVHPSIPVPHVPVARAPVPVARLQTVTSSRMHKENIAPRSAPTSRPSVTSIYQRMSAPVAPRRRVSDSAYSYHEPDHQHNLSSNLLEDRGYYNPAHAAQMTAGPGPSSQSHWQARVLAQADASQFPF